MRAVEALEVAGRRPVRVLSANLHTTSDPRVVVPWLWLMAARHRVDVMTLQEVTPAHARVLRLRPRWVLIREAPYTEAVYGRRRYTRKPRVTSPVSSTWARHRMPGDHPGRSLPLATIRGWLVVGSVHLPPAWTDGPLDRMRAGSGMLLSLPRALPPHVPLFLDGDWNATPARLMEWRKVLGLTRVRGHRIMHASSRRAKLGPLEVIGRARGMDHDAHVIEVTP